MIAVPEADNRIRILGTRGIPGRHGGFESWAEELALFLVKRGWQVTVYCQVDDGRECELEWRGIRLIHIPARLGASWGACLFDLKSTLHAMREGGLVLVFGYNTAILSLLYRLRGIPNLLNMDGMEWKRRKYGFAERTWLRLNEWLGARIADHLIADHPGIERRLTHHVPRQKISVIPYGCRAVEWADPALLNRFGLAPDSYALVIARPEPENSVVEIVRAFGRTRRSVRLVVVGDFCREKHYSRQVLEVAGEDVLFAGPVYERDDIDALRFHARLYIHGHTVGGTNPALIEALGAGTPVLAHDNSFNRAVAGSSANYFRDENECARQFDRLTSPGQRALLAEMGGRGRQRHERAFVLAERLGQYEQLLRRWRVPARSPVTAPLPTRPAPRLDAPRPMPGPVFAEPERLGVSGRVPTE